MTGNPAGAQVFVSYARRDERFVERLVNDLARNGVQVWWDRNLSAGVNWREAIEQELATTRLVLLIASEASAGSDWVLREAALALRAGTATIPVIIDDAGPAALPAALKELQWVDFRLDYDAGLRSLLLALPHYLHSTAPVEPLPQKSKGYVFLSYAEEDDSFVHTALKPLLMGRQLTFWEYGSADRRYDTSIARELEDRIDNAAALVAVLSPDWKMSEWTERELLYAEAVDRPRFLVLARQMRPSILTIGKLVIDFTADQQMAGEHLVKELLKAGL